MKIFKKPKYRIKVVERPTVETSIPCCYLKKWYIPQIKTFLFWKYFVDEQSIAPNGGTEVFHYKYETEDAAKARIEQDIRERECLDKSLNKTITHIPYNYDK
jgi:hypothetical protein